MRRWDNKNKEKIEKENGGGGTGGGGYWNHIEGVNPSIG